MQEGHLDYVGYDKGMTPLLCAAKYGHANVITCLLNHNAKPALQRGGDEQSGKFTPMHVAAQYGHENVLLLLLGKEQVKSMRAARFPPICRRLSPVCHPFAPMCPHLPPFATRFAPLSPTLAISWPSVGHPLAIRWPPVCHPFGLHCPVPIATYIPPSYLTAELDAHWPPILDQGA